jgi:hypothetical protein
MVNHRGPEFAAVLQDVVSGLQWALRTNNDVLPVFQVLVGPRGDDEFEFFLNEVHDGQWYFRRDPAISGPAQECIVTSPAGIPVLAPEIQLLYKSAGRRPKDESDFSRVLPRLEPHRRERLRDLLNAYDPDHPWLPRLAPS